jgi:hypothetical protein
MFKIFKFWFDVIKGAVQAYEEAVVTHGVNPFDKKPRPFSKQSNVQSGKSK